MSAYGGHLLRALLVDLRTARARQVGALACRAEGLACCRARGLAGVLLGLLSAGLLCCAGLTQLGIQPWVCVEAGVWWHKANQPPPFRKRTALDRGPAGAVDRGPLRPPG